MIQKFSLYKTNESKSPKTSQGLVKNIIEKMMEVVNGIKEFGEYFKTATQIFSKYGYVVSIYDTYKLEIPNIKRLYMVAEKSDGSKITTYDIETLRKIESELLSLDKSGRSPKYFNFSFNVDLPYHSNKAKSIDLDRFSGSFGCVEIDTVQYSE